MPESSTPLIEKRTFRALTLVPLSPVFAWLTRLDEQIEQAPSSLRGRPVVLDLSAARLHGPGLRALCQELQQRGVRVVAVSGTEAAALEAEPGMLPPVLEEDASPVVAPQLPAPAPPAALPAAPPPAGAGSGVSGLGVPGLGVPGLGVPGLVMEENIRSGQCVRFPKGDVTILGTVASGAEIIAGGSIHIYGLLRGRALAGLHDPGARIFCNRLDAELLAIGDAFLPSDDMDPSLRGRAVRAWRDNGVIRLSRLE